MRIRLTPSGAKSRLTLTVAPSLISVLMSMFTLYYIENDDNRIPESLQLIQMRQLNRQQLRFVSGSVPCRDSDNKYQLPVRKLVQCDYGRLRPAPGSYASRVCLPGP